MKRKLQALLPYAAALAIDFYLLPLLAKDTGSAMVLMLCVMPVIALTTGVLYGVRQGFSLLPAVTALVLFIPTIFIHYNATAWVYAPAYGVIVLIGNVVGRIFYGKR